MFDYIEKAYSFITTGELKFQEAKNIKAGEVVIGAGDSICSHYLLPCLEKFHAANPEIRIRVKDSTTSEIIRLLQHGEVDIGLINLPVDGAGDLDLLSVVEVMDCFISGQRFYKDFTKPVTLHELAKYPFILLDKFSSTRKFVDDLFWAKNLKIIPDLELGSNDLLVKFVKIGLGITLVNRNLVQKELELQSLYEIKLAEPIPQRRFGIAITKSKVIDGALAKFVSYLIK